MADYRISVYLGAEEDGKRLRELIHRAATMREFNNSQMEFIRRCIHYAVANDPACRELRGSV